MLYDKPFSKENLDVYLKELAKEYRKINGKNTPAEIILVGGAAVIVNYGFREMTYDMDVIINASSSMKDAINYVGDKYGLPMGWINEDFKKTTSYTPKIVQYSKYYKTYSNVVTFRAVSGEYLIAMKLKSGRKYKYDRSDVIGILLEQQNLGNPITFEKIKNAVSNLYGSYEVLSEEIRQFIESVIEKGNYEELFKKTRQYEKENKENLIEYQEEKPGVINGNNLNDIIDILRKRKKENE